MYSSKPRKPPPRTRYNSEPYRKESYGMNENGCLELDQFIEVDEKQRDESRQKAVQNAKDTCKVFRTEKVRGSKNVLDESLYTSKPQKAPPRRHHSESYLTKNKKPEDKVPEEEIKNFVKHNNNFVDITIHTAQKQCPTKSEKRVVSYRSLKTVSKRKLDIGKEHIMQGGRNLFLTKRSEHKTLKAIFGVISGFFLGPLLYLLLVYNFSYDRIVASGIVGTATIVMSIGLALSPTIRCIIAMIFPNFLSGKGRAIFLSIIFGYLLANPVTTINHNVEETVVTMTCMKELAENQTRQIKEEMLKPIRAVIEHVVNAKHNVTSKLRGAGIVGLLGSVAAHFQEQNIGVQHDVRHDSQANSTKSVEKIKETIVAEIRSKTSVFLKVINVIQKVLSVSLLLLFLQSFWYTRSYLSKDAFDNIYITRQFKHLDADAGLEGTERMLPLRPKEKKIYVDTSSIRLNSSEISNCMLGFVHVAIHFLITVFIVFCNVALYFLLDLVQRHAVADITFENNINVTVGLKGEGLVFDIYKALLGDFNLKHAYTDQVPLSSCLPEPISPNDHDIPVLLGMYCFAFVITLLQGYTMRLRRTIAAYYFPEQEEARIHYLLRRMRSKRASQRRFLREETKSTLKERAVLQSMTFTGCLKKKCSCLQLSDNQGICISCDIKGYKENNYKQNGSKSRVQIIECQGQKGRCKAMYCVQCYDVLRDCCPLCNDNSVKKGHIKVRMK